MLGWWVQCHVLCQQWCCACWSWWNTVSYEACCCTGDTQLGSVNFTCWKFLWIFKNFLKSYIDILSTEFANYNKCKWLLDNCSVHKCWKFGTPWPVGCRTVSLQKHCVLTVQSVCKPNFTQTHVRTTLICICCRISDIIIFRVIEIRLQFRSHKGSKKISAFFHYFGCWLLTTDCTTRQVVITEKRLDYCSNVFVYLQVAEEIFYYSQHR